MALIQVDDTNFQKISNFTNVPADQIKDTDLITGLHNGGNANFRIYDIVSKVMEGIDITPGQDPGYDPGGDLGEQVTYSVIIDHSKSDPGKMCTYADDAINFRGKNGWENVKNKPIFKKIKPCVLRNGEVLYYLNPDNYAQKEDGTAADITTLGNDVMVEFGERMGYKFDRMDEDRLKVSVTNRPNAAGYWYDAFSYSGYNDCDKIYVGAYKGYASNGKLYSSSGKTPTALLYINDYRNYARARGNGYEQRWFGSLTLAQALYLIAYCNLDSQSIVGQGYVGGSSAHWTGSTNTYGMCNQNSPNKGGTTLGVKCLGLEDFWGNLNEFIEGFQTDASRNNLLYNFGSTPEWANYGNGGITANVSGYISKVRGERLGFVLAAVNGSESTKYCDVSALRTSCALIYGGDYLIEAGGGAFMASMYEQDFRAETIGSRLMYFHRG